MNRKKVYRNLKRLKHKDKKICNYCLMITANLSLCNRCNNSFCKSCLIEIVSGKRYYCIPCLIEYIQKDVIAIIEK